MRKSEIFGWYDFEALYEYLAENANPAQVYRHLEVGVLFGKSALGLLDAFKAKNKRLILTLVDNFAMDVTWRAKDATRHPSMKSLYEILYGAGAFRNLPDDRQKWFIATMSGAEFYPQIALESLDSAFIDADHSEAACYADMIALYPCIKPGGILAGHDYDNLPCCAGVMPAVERFCAEFGVERTLELGSGEARVYSWRIHKPKQSTNGNLGKKDKGGAQSPEVVA